jgi:hypothetical protein
VHLSIVHRFAVAEDHDARRSGTEVTNGAPSRTSANAIRRGIRWRTGMRPAVPETSHPSGPMRTQ